MTTAKVRIDSIVISQAGKIEVYYTRAAGVLDASKSLTGISLGTKQELLKSVNNLFIDMDDFTLLKLLIARYIARSGDINLTNASVLLNKIISIDLVSNTAMEVA